MSVYDGLSCQPLSCPEIVMLLKKYCTPLGSVAVVAVMRIEFDPVADGTDAHVSAFGEGGVVSARAGVVADCDVDQLPAFCAADLSRV